MVSIIQGPGDSPSSITSDLSQEQNASNILPQANTPQFQLQQVSTPFQTENQQDQGYGFHPVKPSASPYSAGSTLTVGADSVSRNGLATPIMSPTKTLTGKEIRTEARGWEEDKDVYIEKDI